MSKGRGTRTTKAYLCLFVCLTIKSIHLELVSDLSASAFLAAFQRFVSCHGRCTDVCSDCGTNFITNTAISSDSNDLEALTTGHFLTLESLNAPPKTDLTSVLRNRLSRWQMLTQLQQHLWSRWSREYLHTLHQRSK